MSDNATSNNNRITNPPPNPTRPLRLQSLAALALWDAKNNGYTIQAPAFIEDVINDSIKVSLADAEIPPQFPDQMLRCLEGVATLKDSGITKDNIGKYSEVIYNFLADDFANMVMDFQNLVSSGKCPKHWARYAVDFKTFLLWLVDVGLNDQPSPFTGRSTAFKNRIDNLLFTLGAICRDLYGL